MAFLFRRNLLLLYVLGLSALMGACVGTPTTATANPTGTKTPDVATAAPKPLEPEGYTISGVVSGWHLGNRLLRAEATDTDGNIIVVAISRIAVDGTFTITLPRASDRFTKSLRTYSSQTCPELYETEGVPVTELFGPGYFVTPEPLVQVQVALYAYRDVLDLSSDIQIQQRYEDDEGYTYVSYEFSETAGSYQGACVGTYAGSEGRDKGETFDITVDQDYVAGWNSEVYAYTYTETGTRRWLYVGPAPAEVTWTFDDGQ